MVTYLDSTISCCSFSILTKSTQLVDKITSDYVVDAGDNFMCHIAFLFTLFDVHGSVPDCFHSSTIISIHKGHNASVCDSTYFRGIALSALFGIIFDNIILDRYCDKLLSSEL